VRPLPGGALVAALAVAACGGDPGSRHHVVRDSAGVSIIVSEGPDHPLRWSWGPRLRLGGRDAGPEAFYRVSRALTAVDSAGRIFVLDPIAFRVSGFDRNGTVLWTAGARGGGPGELLQPLGVVAPGDGGAAVWDTGKNALVVFDATGTSLDQVPLPRPAAVGRLGRSWLFELWDYTADGLVVRLVRATPGDTAELGLPAVVRIASATFTGCGPAPRRVGPALLSASLRWHASPAGVAVTGGRDYEIRVYRADGTLVRLVRRPGFGRAATRDDALTWARANPVRFMREGAECAISAEEMVELMGFTDSIPVLADVALAPDGALWVRRWTATSDAGPTDLYDPTGAYLGTLPAAFPFPLHFLPSGEPLFAERDADEVERLVVAGITR
jgi:hypothetical protein